MRFFTVQNCTPERKNVMPWTIFVIEAVLDAIWISVIVLFCMAGCECPANHFQPAIERQETSGAAIGGWAGTILDSSKFQRPIAICGSRLNEKNKDGMLESSLSGGSTEGRAAWMDQPVEPRPSPMGSHPQKGKHVSRYQARPDRIPIHPISHERYGRMRIGRADAWGNE